MRDAFIGIRRFLGIRWPAAAVVVAAMAGCGGSADLDETGRKGPDATDHGIPTIGVCQSDRSDPWRAEMDADIEAAVKRHSDLKVVFVDAGGQSEKQKQQVEQFVKQGVDLLIVCPIEAQSATEPVAKAYDAGIPVIVLHRCVVGNKYRCFLGTDDKQIGAAVARWVTDQVPGRVNVLELEDPRQSTPTIDRHDGFRAALIDPRFSMLPQVAVSGKEDIARREMEQALGSFEKIDVVFAHNDAAAHDAYLAAKQAGRESDITFVGVGGLPSEGIEYVRAGELDATFQSPTAGAEAVDVAVRLLKAEEVPKRIMLKSRFFTKENLATGGQTID